MYFRFVIVIILFTALYYDFLFHATKIAFQTRNVREKYQQETAIIPRRNLDVMPYIIRILQMHLGVKLSFYFIVGFKLRMHLLHNTEKVKDRFNNNNYYFFFNFQSLTHYIFFVSPSCTELIVRRTPLISIILTILLVMYIFFVYKTPLYRYI